MLPKEYVEAARALRPARGQLALRTKGTSSFGGPMFGATTETLAEYSDFKPADVDPATLTLPGDYTETALAMFSAMPGNAPMTTDGGAKWKAPPRGH